MGSPRNGPSDDLKREGKRKVLVDHSRSEAHMQNAVQSIAIGPNVLSKCSNKESIGLESPGLMFSPSVKGKK